MTAAHHQGQHRKFQLVVALLALLQQNSVDVPLEMINSDERLLDGIGERLGVTQPNQQRPREPGPLGHRNSIDRLVRPACLVERLAHHGNDGAQMLARGQFWHHPTVGAMGDELGINDIGDQLLPRAHHRSGGFVAGALDAENVRVGHRTIVKRGPGLRPAPADLFKAPGGHQ